MQVPIYFPPLTPFAHLFIEQNFFILPTSNLPPLQILSYPHRPRNDHLHKRNTSSLFTLCTAIIIYILLCGYSPSRADNATTFTQQNADFKSNFKVRTGTPFSMKPNPLSGVSPPLICFVPPPRGFTWALAQHHHHYHQWRAISHRSLPHPQTELES